MFLFSAAEIHIYIVASKDIFLFGRGFSLFVTKNANYLKKQNNV